MFQLIDFIYKIVVNFGLAILAVTVVRVIDASRSTHTVATPALASAVMVGADGVRVGHVTVSGTTPAGVAVNVDYAVPDGTYSVELRRHGIDGKPLGNIVIVDGRGEWIGTAALRSRASTTLAMVDSTGNVVCHAAISTASSVAS